MAFKHYYCGGSHETVMEARACNNRENSKGERIGSAFRSGHPGAGVATYKDKMVVEGTLRKLLKMLDHPSVPPKILKYLRDRIQDDCLTQKLASESIDNIKKLMADTAVVEDGFYKDPRPDGLFWKVQESIKTGGKLYASYAKIIRQPEYDENGNVTQHAEYEWLYIPGAMTNLLCTWKLDAAGCGEFGKLYGVCIKCHTKLTKQSSIEQGMGDTCAGKV